MYTLHPRGDVRKSNIFFQPCIIVLFQLDGNVYEPLIDLELILLPEKMVLTLSTFITYMPP